MQKRTRDPQTCEASVLTVLGVSQSAAGGFSFTVTLGFRGFPNLSSFPASQESTFPKGEPFFLLGNHKKKTVIETPKASRAVWGTRCHETGSGPMLGVRQLYP